VTKEKQKEKRQVKKTKSRMRKMVCDTSFEFICADFTVGIGPTCDPALLYSNLGDYSD
jgi:hypothetical protein